MGSHCYFTFMCNCPVGWGFREGTPAVTRGQVRGPACDGKYQGRLPPLCPWEDAWPPSLPSSLLSASYRDHGSPEAGAQGTDAVLSRGNWVQGVWGNEKACPGPARPSQAPNSISYKGRSQAGLLRA